MHIHTNTLCFSICQTPLSAFVCFSSIFGLFCLLFIFSFFLSFSYLSLKHTNVQISLVYAHTEYIVPAEMNDFVSCVPVINQAI